jgi:hypothetical protein
VILRGPMRPLAVLFVLSASLALQGCGVHSCQELGNRLCQCAGAGSTRDNCKIEVKNQLSAVGLNDSNYAACEAALITCNAPTGAAFCEWINTGCAKASCGLSNESPSDPNVCAP